MKTFLCPVTNSTGPLHKNPQRPTYISDIAFVLMLSDSLLQQNAITYPASIIWGTKYGDPS